MILLCQSVLNPKMKILFSATILPPIHATSFVLIHYVKRKSYTETLISSFYNFTRCLDVKRKPPKNQNLSKPQVTAQKKKTTLTIQEDP